LVWDDFSVDGAAPEDGTNLLGLNTGGPNTGSLRGWFNQGWVSTATSGTGGTYGNVFDSNENINREPLRYGTLETSGLFTSVQSFWVEIMRSFQLTSTQGRAPALADYIGAGGVGGVEGSTLWFSTLMRNPDPDNRNGYIFFSSGNAPIGNIPYGQSPANGTQLAIGTFRDRVFQEMPYGHLQNVKFPNVYYNTWGVRYLTDPNIPTRFMTPVNINFGWNPDWGQFIHRTTFVDSNRRAYADETMLIVGKFEFNGDGRDVVTVWFNPDQSSLGGGMPIGGHRVDVTLPEGMNFRPNMVGLQGCWTGAVDFADLRFGTTFAAVTPVLFCECCETYNCDCCGECYEFCVDCGECIECGCERCEVCDNCPCDCVLGIIMVEENDRLFVDRLAFFTQGVDTTFTAIISVFVDGRFERVYHDKHVFVDLSHGIADVSFRHHDIEWLPGMTLRAFLWDGFNVMRPLTEVFEYPN